MGTISDLDKLKMMIIQSVESNDFETALRLITDFVTDVVRDRRAVVNVLASEELDELCKHIGKKSIELNPEITQGIGEVQENTVIYIVTELYNTGGHSAVIEDFIACQPDKNHIILATDILEQFNINNVEDRYCHPSVILEQAPNSGLYPKLRWLQQKLIQHSPSQIFLINHHQDAVAIAAIYLDIDSQIVFYHHADHQLCLGVYLSNVIHVDPHPQGFYNCRNQLGIKNNFYLPLSAKDFGCVPASERKFMASGSIKTCSSGNQHKFEQEYRYNYSEIIPRILQETKGSHIHIGPLSETTLAKIRDGLQNYGLQSKNFVHIPWVKSVWSTLREQDVDLYLESFPLGGGKTAIEVMGAGIPIIGHQNYKSRLLCCFDINYPEALFWRKPSELYEILSTITPEFLKEQSLYARRHYERFHSFDATSQQFSAICNGKMVYEPPPFKNYQLDPLQAFIDHKKTHDNIILQLQSDITGMESSFFWKIRNQWFMLKELFGLVKNE